MKIELRTLLPAVLGVALSSSAFAGGLKMIQHEDAIEANTVEFLIGPSGTGSVVVRSCDTCQPVRLSVNADTKAFENGDEVSMSSLGGKTKKTAVVFFLVKDGSVTRITW